MKKNSAVLIISLACLVICVLILFTVWNLKIPSMGIQEIPYYYEGLHWQPTGWEYVNTHNETWCLTEARCRVGEDSYDCLEFSQYATTNCTIREMYYPISKTCTAECDRDPETCNEVYEIKNEICANDIAPNPSWEDGLPASQCASTEEGKVLLAECYQDDASHWRVGLRLIRPSEFDDLKERCESLDYCEGGYCFNYTVDILWEYNTFQCIEWRQPECPIKGYNIYSQIPLKDGFTEFEIHIIGEVPANLFTECEYGVITDADSGEILSFIIDNPCILSAISVNGSCEDAIAEYGGWIR